MVTTANLADAPIDRFLVFMRDDTNELVVEPTGVLGWHVLCSKCRNKILARIRQINEGHWYHPKTPVRKKLLVFVSCVRELTEVKRKFRIFSRRRLFPGCYHCGCKRGFRDLLDDF